MSEESPSPVSPVKRRIVVAGDICIDVVAVPERPPAKRPGTTLANWRQMGEMKTHHVRGGAMLLADMIRAAVEPQSPGAVLGPDIPTPSALSGASSDKVLREGLFERLTREEVVHSLLEAQRVCESFDEAHKKTSVIRVHRAHGFSGPASDDTLLTAPQEASDAELVVLDDAGNLFRHSPKLWPKQIEGPTQLRPSILLKLHRPLPGDDDPTSSNRLWDTLEANHADRLVVVVKVEDLRLAGADIRGGLSWEQTAMDFAREMQGHPALRRLRRCRWLIAQCGLDGALCWHNPGGGASPRLWLTYDPGGIEGHAAAQVPGWMTGGGSAFTAGLAWALHQFDLPSGSATSLPEGLSGGMRAGLTAARELLVRGFSPTPLSYPVKAVAGRVCAPDGWAGFCEMDVPLPGSAANPDGERWSILKAILPGGNDLYAAAVELAETGKTSRLARVPVGKFGDIQTYDRREIEAYRSLSNLIREYMGHPSPTRPLCVSVFGPPGSGKSFGVEEVTKSVATGGIKIERRTFNLSQFQSPEDLRRALHLVRDDVIAGKLPLVFFDEFDSPLESELYWLKFLLAPMQDGNFVEQGATHKIGKAIFVFAGGTAYRYRAFARLEVSEDPVKRARAERAFRNVKGPDFVSRLRGTLDIPGIDHSDDYRGAALLRRAGILSYQTQKKAPNLFDSDKRLRITPGVLRAFLNVKAYEHGVRSLEALLDMSRLLHRDHFDASCLPSEEQMGLHVVARQSKAPGLGFVDLIDRESPFPTDVRDLIARAIHEDYVQRRHDKNQFDPDRPSHKSWSELSPFYKDSNRTQADDIPRKLRLLGLDFGPKAGAGRRSVVGDLKAVRDEKIIEDAAKGEHERWLSERRLLGWVYAEKHNDQRRESPAMCPWNKLKEDDLDKDRASITGIPSYLEAADYAVFDPKEKLQA